jgi:alcohol dehydrogenase
MKMTNGRGVDTAIEAVGVPASFITCEDIVAPRGTIANVGAPGVKFDLHLERLWSQNITITTRLVDTITVDRPDCCPGQRQMRHSGPSHNSRCQ